MNIEHKMNEAIDYIEKHIINDSLNYQEIANIMLCSTYEFSRLFSFIAGKTLSEYIRCRKLSLAAFDIQQSNVKITELAQKYGYDSQSSFSRAFKALHRISPTIARKKGVSLKTYPKLYFEVDVLGKNELNFRIVEKDRFEIIGLKGFSEDIVLDGEVVIDKLWHEFLSGSGNYNKRLRKYSYYTAPIWQIGAYKYKRTRKGTECIIGAELMDKPLLTDMDVEVIQPAVYAVFSIVSKTGSLNARNAYARIITQWFPSSPYKRDISKPHFEVYPPGNVSDDYYWEIWMPIYK